MSKFKIGDWVYAGDYIYGQITDIYKDEATVEFQTPGGGGGNFDFALNELQKAKPPKSYSIRDNLLVTAGARAAYMDMRGTIELPRGLEGEDRLAEFVVDTIRAYGKIPDDTPFDEFIEKELIHEFGKKHNGPIFIKYDKETRDWFDKHPEACTTVTCCEKCGLYYKPILGHKCKKGN